MLRANLDKYSNATAIHATHAISEDINADQIARIARVQVATSYKTDLVASDEITSNWWLMHFVDREPIEVAIWPPCNQAGAFASYPKAIAVEPLPSPVTVEASPHD